MLTTIARQNTMEFGRQKEFPHIYNPYKLESYLVRADKYSYDPGDLTWLLGCTSLTWIMLPGVGFFYNGLARNKSSLSLLILCLWSSAVVSVQWWVIGYSLCLSSTGGSFIGNADNVFLWNVGDVPSVGNRRVPALLVGIWYGLFAAIAPTIFTGAVAERARFFPTVLFMVAWTTLVFDFLVYWTWNENGWSRKRGTLDFGGGTPVHMSTGATALAYALMVGKRKNRAESKPHNMTHVVLGTCFIWMGWLVANAGSGFSPNLRAITTFAATNLSASVGGVTWALLDFLGGKKWSPLGFCCGVVSGLVAVTPASGFISPSSSIIFGSVGATMCNFTLRLKDLFPIDDAFDVFCVHGVGAIVGNLLTGVFAEKSIAALDSNTQIEGGGFYDGNWEQVGIQVIDTLAGTGWSFFISLVILCIMNNIRGCGLRAKVKDEESGLDEVELGYSNYEFVEELRSQVDELSEKVSILQKQKCDSSTTISVASSVITPTDVGGDLAKEKDDVNHNL